MNNKGDEEVTMDEINEALRDAVEDSEIHPPYGVTKIQNNLKERRKQSKKKHLEAHGDRIRAELRDRYKNDEEYRESSKERQKRFYQNNPEKYSEYKSRRLPETIQKQRDRQRAYYQLNKEKIKAQKKLRYQKNKEAKYENNTRST